jgi:hypothetical protein
MEKATKTTETTNKRVTTTLKRVRLTDPPTKSLEGVGMVNTSCPAVKLERSEEWAVLINRQPSEAKSAVNITFQGLQR